MKSFHKNLRRLKNEVKLMFGVFYNVNCRNSIIIAYILLVFLLIWCAKFSILCFTHHCVDSKEMNGAILKKWGKVELGEGELQCIMLVDS